MAGHLAESLLERLVKQGAKLGRLRGVGRTMRLVYPAGVGSRRFVRGIRRRADGLLMDVDSREVIDWCVIFYGEYEPHMRGLLERALGAGDVAIDIGANIGAHSLTMARLVGPAGRVLAFEPNPPVRRRLQRNVELNDLLQVTVIPRAAGACSARLQLMVPAEDSREGANPGLASLVALETPHTIVDVDVSPLDAVADALQVGRVAVIKIDVQGYECQVLQGAKKTLGVSAPVVMFEYEPWAWSRAGTTYEDARRLLESFSYDLWCVGAVAGGETRLVPLKAEPADHAEIVAIHRERYRAGALRALTTDRADG